MDAVDASTHYEVSTADEAPALLTIVVDTNPRAWAALANTLPLSKTIANLLVFANSHLALSSANKVAFIAAHCNRAVWLYPSPRAGYKSASFSSSSSVSTAAPTSIGKKRSASVLDNDVEIGQTKSSKGNNKSSSNDTSGTSTANKFPQFREVETTLLHSVRDLVTSTTESDIAETTTFLSGALTLALAHINKTSLMIPSAVAGSNSKTSGKSLSQQVRYSEKAGAGTGSKTNTGAGNSNISSTDDGTGAPADVGLYARILVVSVSDSSPAQYIPTMNAVFAASHAGVAIDVLALRGAATFLQQAAYITRGTFMAVPADAHIQGLLAYLMLGFSASSARDVARYLVAPSVDAVDFRAACFCHRRVVDTGFVCSICLSIFCDVPTPSTPATQNFVECLTCGSRLRLGLYGTKPAVVPRSKKKRRKRLVGSREETTSASRTPVTS